MAIQTTICFLGDPMLQLSNNVEIENLPETSEEWLYAIINKDIPSVAKSVYLLFVELMLDDMDAGNNIKFRQWVNYNLGELGYLKDYFSYQDRREGVSYMLHYSLDDVFSPIITLTPKSRVHWWYNSFEKVVERHVRQKRNC